MSQTCTTHMHTQSHPDLLHLTEICSMLFIGMVLASAHLVKTEAGASPWKSCLSSFTHGSLQYSSHVPSSICILPCLSTLRVVILHAVPGLSVPFCWYLWFWSQYQLSFFVKATKSHTRFRSFSSLEYKTEQRITRS